MRTWVHGADESGFGLENLPYGVARRAGRPPRPVVRVGDYVLELAAVLDGDAFEATDLNAFIALGPPAWADARRRVLGVLTDRATAEPALVSISVVEVLLPVAVGDYLAFRGPGVEPVPVDWRDLPAAHHGRAGTVVVSGTPVRRPQGLRGPGDFGPERQLDFGLELGFVAGTREIFGAVLLNGWSAREIQRFESQPLGPFLGTSFATSISPWVVPLEALPRVAGPPQDPQPAEYLRYEEPWGLAVDLEAELNGEVLARANAAGLYWTVAQMLAHATVNGATLAPGDLIGSGPVSELTGDRDYLADGDEVVIRGRAGAISFGEVRAVVLPPAVFVS